MEVLFKYFNYYYCITVNVFIVLHTFPMEFSARFTDRVVVHPLRVTVPFGSALQVCPVFYTMQVYPVFLVVNKIQSISGVENQCLLDM